MTDKNTQEIDLYISILNHLKEKNIAFCFYNGSIIDRETCEKKIIEWNDKNIQYSNV